MVLFYAPTLSTQLLHIQPATPDQPLSEAQQAFNRLLGQLEAARQQWNAWQAAMQDVQTRYAQQVRPLMQQLWQAQAQLAQQLDQCSAASISKLERQTLEQLIVQLSEDGAQQAPAGPLRDTLAELYTRYAPLAAEVVHDDAATDKIQGVAAAAAAEEVDWDDPDAVAAYVDAQTQAAQAQAQRERAAHQQQRQRQQAQRKAQAAQQAATKPSVKAVYRKLASSLHPDREADLQARARKTALMQRVNQAYEADDLLALLEFQWEVEQLDASRLAQLQDTHLLRYNQVLQEQLQQLQQAVRDSEAALAEMLGLNPHQRHAPHKMPKLLRQYVQSLQQQVAQLQHASAHLQHQPETLGDWLRAQR